MRHTKNLVALLGCFIILLLYGGWCGAGEGQGSPKIDVPQPKHSFAAVFEGEPLSHTFEVVNRGEAELIIKKVTHS
jgi:hypothetical protein